ncbi:MAG: hypothetical protein AAGG50_21175 [Bacteroidota bacterium]
MQQTLFALCALSLALFLSLNQQQAQNQVEAKLDRAAVRQLAVTRATDVLDALEAYAFDAQTDVGIVSDAAMLTPAPFPMGRPFASATDLDDLHGMQTLRDSVATEQGWVPLSIDAAVMYVDKVGSDYVPAASPTFTKQVTLVVRGPLDVRTEISRVYGYTY